MVVRFLSWTLWGLSAISCAANPQAYISIFSSPQYPEGQFLSPYANPDAPQGGHLALGSEGTFTSFYPLFRHGQEHDPSELIYATLFKRSPDEIDVAYPYIASHVEIEDNAVSFILRPEACFHDGSPIRPEDVIFTFHLMVKHHYPTAHYYKEVQSIEKTGNNRVTFLLKPGAAKELPLILSEMPVFSEAFFKAHDPEKNPLTPPLGNGPYRLAQIIPGRSRYEKIPNWWGQNVLFNKGSYNFQTISYAYFRDLTALFEAFKRGEIDYFYEPLAHQWAHGYDFPAEGNVKKQEVPHQLPVGHKAFIFNTRFPLFKDLRVRKALALMLDFGWLNQNLFFNSYTRTTSFFENTPFQAAGLPSADEATILAAVAQDFPTAAPIVKEAMQTAPEALLPLDLTQGHRMRTALTLLRDAGWELNQGALQHPQFGPFTFTLLIPAGQVNIAAQALKRDLKTIGITMDIQAIEAAAYLKRVKALDFHMIEGNLSYSYIPGSELVSIYGSLTAHQKGTLNLAGIEDAAIDFIISKILSAMTLEDLKLYSHVLDRLLIASFYTIAQWYLPKHRIAFWDRFGQPERLPPDGENIFQWWEKVPQKATTP